MPLFQKLLRKSQDTDCKLLNLFYRVLYFYSAQKHHIEIFSSTKIGGGLYIGHAYGITVNENASIGTNCNLHKGVTIGQENRGPRAGAPTIGNNVWIGINASIVGKITVGNDVLIAPNSYVNCDIPDHSVVFGNPCIIKHRDNATQDYINRPYDFG
ncbi:MAG: serine acetyltransferase [Clostridia bacterium]|nr:serine acetyltransferase [Clostridia bacterium]